MKLDWSHWIYTLLKTVIGGVAGAGSAWLGTLVGSQINSNIHALDMRQLGFVMLSSTLLNLFFFLKQSPLPEDSDKAGGIADKLTSVLVIGLVSFGLMFGVSGCGTVQVKPGHDPIVVHAEYIAENGLNWVNEFLLWENAHYVALKKKNPDIAKFAQSLRAERAGEVGPAERQIIELRTLTETYKKDRTEANGDKVKLGTMMFLNLVNSARAYSGLPPITLPPTQPGVRDLMKNAPANAPPAKS